ncbi:unnamed protein product [Diamesa serratosioi]
MPKCRKTNAVRSGKKSTNNYDTRNDNPLASVFIKASESEISGSDSSESSESEDNRQNRKSRKSTQKMTSCDCKKNYRKLQNQIDLFQRNNDIKLNYIESLLQNLLKNNNAPSTTIVSSSNIVYKSETNISKPLKYLKPKTPLIVKRSTIPVHIPQEFDTPADESIVFDVPKFPIIDIDLLVDFNEHLLRSKKFRQELAEVLAPCTNSSTCISTLTRIKSLCYQIIHLDVWVSFSFTGRSAKNGRAAKNAFKDFIGVLALVQETCNYGKDAESLIDEKDSKNGVVDAIKRAPEKRLQMLSKGVLKSELYYSDEDKISLLTSKKLSNGLLNTIS